MLYPEAVVAGPARACPNILISRNPQPALHLCSTTKLGFALPKLSRTVRANSASPLSSSWDEKPYQVLQNGKIMYLDEQDIVTFLDPPNELIPLDPSSYNPASYLCAQLSTNFPSPFCKIIDRALVIPCNILNSHPSLLAPVTACKTSLAACSLDVLSRHLLVMQLASHNCCSQDLSPCLSTACCDHPYHYTRGHLLARLQKVILHSQHISLTVFFVVVVRKKIEDIPEERRHRLLSLLKPRLISQAWEIAGTRYYNPKLVQKSASSLIANKDGETVAEFWKCRTSGGPLQIAWLNFFRKVVFRTSNGKHCGRLISESVFSGLSNSFYPLYFTVSELKEVMSTEQPCDIAYEFKDGILDVPDLPRGFPKPAKHPWPFNDEIVIYVRHAGPGVMVGQAWQEGKALQQVPKKLCSEILMVKESASSPPQTG